MQFFVHFVLNLRLTMGGMGQCWDKASQIIDSKTWGILALWEAEGVWGGGVMSPDVNYWLWSQSMLWVITLAHQTLDTTQRRATVTAWVQRRFSITALNIFCSSFLCLVIVHLCDISINWVDGKKKFRSASCLLLTSLCQIWAVTGIYRQEAAPPPHMM